MIKVYISSTYEDLKGYRVAVIQALRKMQGVMVVGMEDYTAADDRPLSRCLRDTRECEVFVGIYARCYGFRPTTDNPENLSITELEYRCAVESNRRVLCFRLDDQALWPDHSTTIGTDYLDLKKFLSRVCDERLAPAFKNETELVGHVLAAVANEKAKAGVRRAHGSGVIPPIAPKMCDRTPQESDFIAFYESKRAEAPFQPQIYIVHGLEAECPKSFVERLLEYVRHDPPKHSEAAGEASVCKSISSRWIDEGDPDSRDQGLRVSLFNSFRKALFNAGDHRRDDGALDSKSLVKLAKTAPYSCFPVEYLIYAHKWSAVKAALERHLAFWDGIDPADNPPLFLVFFKIILPQPPIGPTQQLLARFAGRRPAIDPSALTQGRRCFYKPLPELRPVTAHHVSEWHDEYPVFPSSKAFLESKQKLFPKVDTHRNMSIVEAHLQDWYDDYEQRYLEFN